MKRIWFMGAAGLMLLALLISSSGVEGQAPPKKGPFPGKGDGKGKGFGGGGFERPLASEPRRGNPGASPNLTAGDFRDLIANAKDFDTNKDGKLTKAELPEMFASFFDRADTNRDGFLDQDEMQRVLAATPAKSQSSAGPAKKDSTKAP
jgi:hypothetical protein